MLEHRAYGCFGFVTTYDEASETCQGCPARKRCREVSYQALKKMSSELDVTGLLARFRDLAEADQGSIGVGVKKPQSRRARLKQYAQSRDSVLLAVTLPQKERRIIQGIERKGILIKPLLRAGLNPFERQRPAFMQVPCRLLLERQRFTRPQLKQALMVSFPHWSEATAETNASVALRVLVALKVVQKHNDTYVKAD